MIYRNEERHECGEPIDRGNGEHAADQPWNPRASRKVWHFQCLPEERVASGQQSIMPDYLSRYNTWRIRQLEQKLLRENEILRQRTSALSRVLRNLMRENGAREEDIEDFLCEYRLKDGENSGTE